MRDWLLDIQEDCGCLRMGHKMEMLPPFDLQELKKEIIEATAKTLMREIGCWICKRFVFDTTGTI